MSEVDDRTDGQPPASRSSLPCRSVKTRISRQVHERLLSIACSKLERLDGLVPLNSPFLAEKVLTGAVRPPDALQFHWGDI